MRGRRVPARRSRRSCSPGCSGASSSTPTSGCSTRAVRAAAGTRSTGSATGLALPSIALLEVWRGTGFWALFLLAALLAVSRELYDAAAIDGASPWSRFRFVTLPGSRPTLLVAVVLTTLVSMQVFDSVFVLTNGGPAGATDTAVLYIYRSVFESGDPGYGAVLSLILMALIVLLTVVIVRVTGAGGRHERGRPLGWASRRSARSRWLPFAYVVSASFKATSRCSSSRRSGSRPSRRSATTGGCSPTCRSCAGR